MLDNVIQSDKIRKNLKIYFDITQLFKLDNCKYVENIRGKCIFILYCT